MACLVLAPACGSSSGSGGGPAPALSDLTGTWISTSGDGVTGSASGCDEVLADVETAGSTEPVELAVEEPDVLTVTLLDGTVFRGTYSDGSWDASTRFVLEQGPFDTTIEGVVSLRFREGDGGLEAAGHTETRISIETLGIGPCTVRSDVTLVPAPAPAGT